MSELDVSLLAKAGLEPQRIRKHQERIRAAVRNEVQTTIPVTNACTVKNGGVISWDTAGGWIAGAAENQGEGFFSDAHAFWCSKHMVTAVPAAGAASRFLSELQKFSQDMESAIPLLALVIGEKSAGKTAAKISDEERKTAINSLASFRIPEKMTRLVALLQEQTFPEVRTVWDSLHAELMAALTGDSAALRCPSSSKTCGSTGALDTTGADCFRAHWRFSEAYQNPSGENSCGGGCGGCGGAQPRKKVEGENSLRVYSATKALLKLYGGVPKAMVATTNEGDTFLRLKLVEQISLFPSSGNVLIVPPGQIESTKSIVKEEGEYLKKNYGNVFALSGTPFAPDWLVGERKERGQWLVLEQGKDLSTIRFNMDGSPYIENGNYSVVAAGHGELVHLFDKIVSEFPESECLHVRNIDNVVGATDERRFEMAVLSDVFRLLRDAVEFLRHEVDAHVSKGKAGKKSGGERDVLFALDFLSALVPERVAAAALGSFVETGDELQVTPEALYQILGNLFYWPNPGKLTGAPLWEQIQKLLARPLSVFGVVKKEDADVGGGPVFVRLPDGTEAKLCMEMPHASPEDSKTYFGAGGKASHFNPVLTFFELRTHTQGAAGRSTVGKNVDFRHLLDERFWLLSKKEFQGKSVCYHETVLYELIGNSATANLVFVEVPRSLFNPHKTFFDSLGRSRGSYGFDQILGKQQAGAETT